MTNELGKAIFKNCRHHDHTPCAQSKANKTAHPHYDSRCKNWWRFGKFILNERIPKTQHLGRETIMKFYTTEGNKVSCYGDDPVGSYGWCPTWTIKTSEGTETLWGFCSRACDLVNQQQNKTKNLEFATMKVVSDNKCGRAKFGMNR